VGLTCRPLLLRPIRTQATVSPTTQVKKTSVLGVRAVHVCHGQGKTAPMTYLAKGRQYIVFATGGAMADSELVALAVRQ
jgi:hypothetical protein